MKTWTKVEVADAIDHYVPNEEYNLKCSISIEAWEHYDDKCDIDHPNWKKYNENFEVVAVVFGVVYVSGKAEIRVQYEQEDYEVYKANLLIQRAIKDGMEIIKKELDTYLNQ